MKIEKKSYYETSRDKKTEVHYHYGTNCCDMHFHRQVELLYSVDTYKHCFVNGEKIQLKPKELLFVDSFTPHAYEDVKGDSAVFILPQKYLLKYDKFMENKTLLSNISKDYLFNEKIHELMKDITNADSKNVYLYQSLIDYLLSQVVNKLGYKTEKDFADKEFSEKILEFIQKNYKENITLDVIAKEFGYSKTYFSHLFNSIFNINLNEYLSIIRLEHTLADLKQKKCSVTTAALENGFNSMQTFYRVYKKNKF